jgi:hypothetical protein
MKSGQIGLQSKQSNHFRLQFNWKFDMLKTNMSELIKMIDVLEVMRDTIWQIHIKSSICVANVGVKHHIIGN